MKKLWGAVYKEILVLVRDLPALMFLFIMPALMMIIISIAEDRVTNHNNFTVLLIAPDSSEIKQVIVKKLEKSQFFKIKNIPEADSTAIVNAKKDIANGKYQAGIIISANAFQHMNKRAEELVSVASTNPGSLKDSIESKSQKAIISIIFDPAIKESLKYPLISALNGIFTGVEIKIIIQKYFNNLENVIRTQLKASIDSLKQSNLSRGIPDSPFKNELILQIKKSMEQVSDNDIDLKIPEFPWQAESLITLNETTVSAGKKEIIEPSVSQNRVPGFTLFAMFFIVLPLAGSLVTERNEGAYNRLRTLPVSYFTLISGKVIVYSIVCLLQFVFMIFIGLYVLSGVFEMQALVMGTHFFALFITAIISALAAIGFGLIIGSLARTHSQASSVGSFMVVILGILGGVFIPVYLIPENIRVVTMVSPIRWGIDAFVDIFVRNEGLYYVFPDICRLFLFFILSLIFTLLSFNQRK